MSRPVITDAVGVEVLSPASQSPLARELEEDDRLISALEVRLGFKTESNWGAWRNVALTYANQRYSEAKAHLEAAHAACRLSPDDRELYAAAERNLRRVMALSWRVAS